MKLLFMGRSDLPCSINQAQTNDAVPKSASLLIMLRYLTAPFIQGFQHALLSQANPSPNRILRERVKTAPEINMGC